MIARSLPSCFLLWPAFVLLCAGTLLPAAVAAKSERETVWDPVPPADLAATDSTTSPGADVEFLLNRQILRADYRGVHIENIIRAKIYTAKGVHDWGRFHTEARPGTHTEGLAGRVVKADGSVVTMNKSDFHESTLVEYEGEKSLQTDFAFPNLAPGDVIEARWIETLPLRLHSLQIFIQETFPVKEFQFKVENFPEEYWIEWQNCRGELTPGKGAKSMSLVVHNLPAFEHEEAMPAEWEFRAGLLLIRNNVDYTSNQLWKEISANLDDRFREHTPTGGGVTDQARRLVAGATTDDEKLARLYDFCQREIENIDTSETPAAKATKDKRLNNYADLNQTPGATIKKRSGWSYEINYLFAALARSLGYPVKQTVSASRREVLNVDTEKGWAHLDHTGVAVKVGETWRFCEPGEHAVPYGMLFWSYEGVTALLCDQKQKILLSTPISPAEKSAIVRRGRFTLDAEGNLEGEVAMTFSGHAGMERKLTAARESADDFNRNFREDAAQRIATAEITDLQWTNLTTTDYPVTAHYRVHVTGYAERAGQRLVVVPNYFLLGVPPRFTAETRKYPVYFPYAYEAHDDIEMRFPAGFELDHASAPANIAPGDPTLSAHYQLRYNRKLQQLEYKRDFVLGANGIIAFRAASYPELKKRYAALNRSDLHSLVLKPTGAPAPMPASPPAAAPEPPDGKN